MLLPCCADSFSGRHVVAYRNRVFSDANLLHQCSSRAHSRSGAVGQRSAEHEEYFRCKNNEFHTGQEITREPA